MKESGATSTVVGIPIGTVAVFRAMADERITIEARGGRSALEPGQGLLPRARADEARPRQLLPPARRAGAEPPATAPDLVEAVRRRRREEAFFQKRIPDSAPEWLSTAVVTFPSGREARELVVNDAAHLAWGVNLGVIDWNPWPVASRTSTTLTSCASISIRRLRRAGTTFARRRSSSRTSSPTTASRAFRRPAARAGSTSTSASTRGGTSSRCAARPSRSPARWNGAPRRSPRASGGRRSGAACSSTTTRTRATAPSRRPTASGRPRTPGCRHPFAGTRCPTSSTRSCESTPCRSEWPRSVIRAPTSTRTPARSPACSSRPHR